MAPPSPSRPFYADILCFSEALVIEVDGDTHADTVERDEARTRFIQSEGYRVIRFNNADVMRNSDGVIAAVAALINSDTEKGSAA